MTSADSRGSRGHSSLGSSADSSRTSASEISIGWPRGSGHVSTSGSVGTGRASTDFSTRRTRRSSTWSSRCCALPAGRSRSRFRSRSGANAARSTSSPTTVLPGSCSSSRSSRPFRTTRRCWPPSIGRSVSPRRSPVSAAGRCGPSRGSLVIADTMTSRRRVARLASTFEAAFPVRGHAVRRWLREPTAPVAGLLFLTYAPPGSGRKARSVRERVRRPSPGAQTCRKVGTAPGASV